VTDKSNYQASVFLIEVGEGAGRRVVVEHYAGIV
jgi:hypothetical protein